MSLSPEYLEAILNGPALLAPPGVTTNFNSKDSNAVYVLPVAVTVASITTILLILRIYTKRVLTRSMAWEDCKVSNFWLRMRRLTHLKILLF